jgi:hypothetical protein
MVIVAFVARGERLAERGEAGGGALLRKYDMVIG